MELALGDGAYVSNRSRHEKWGTSIIDSISEQLRREFPGLRGFSARSIRNMRTFYEYWKQFLIWQPSAAKLQLSINQYSIDIECFSLQKWSPVAIYKMENAGAKLSIISQKAHTLGHMLYLIIDEYDNFTNTVDYLDRFSFNDSYL